MLFPATGRTDASTSGLRPPIYGTDATLIHTANSVILQVGEITDEIFQDRFQ